jgi:hypothetical protein
MRSARNRHVRYSCRFHTDMRWASRMMRNFNIDC